MSIFDKLYRNVSFGSFWLPNGRSRVFDGVRTTGRELRCLFPRRNPVELVSTSDMIPGSSSNSIEFDGGGYPRDSGDWGTEKHLSLDLRSTIQYFSQDIDVNYCTQKTTTNHTIHYPLTKEKLCLIYKDFYLQNHKLLELYGNTVWIVYLFSLISRSHLW